jgi:hypothetical protein
MLLAVRHAAAGPGGRRTQPSLRSVRAVPPLIADCYDPGLRGVTRVLEEDPEIIVIGVVQAAMARGVVARPETWPAEAHH